MIAIPIRQAQTLILSVIGFKPFDNMIKNLLAIIANQKKQINYVERPKLETTLKMLKGKLTAGKI